nr:uncharacterized mitochondrial protein AtMg00810-like [Tanacetum cinerariifolium]
MGTPQQNGVVERRNRTLVEAARTMLTFAKLSLFLLAEAIVTACFIQNSSIIHKRFDKTPYELMNKRKPNIKFFRVFGCRCYLLNDYEAVGKLKAKGYIGVFVGYSKESAAFKIYNKRTRKIHESVNVNFDEISEMASKQFSLEPGLSNLNETRKSSNPSVSQVFEKSKKDLEDLFQDFYDEYFDSSKIMKSSTTNVETSINEEVFHEEEVYVGQPLGFVSKQYLDHVYALDKALYGLKQAPRACSKPELQSITSRQISSGLDLTYAPSTITTQQPSEGKLDLLFEAMYDDFISGQPSAALRTVLAAQAHENHFFKGTTDPTLFIRRFIDDILVVQVYVDDIIFGSTHPRPDIVHATYLCARYQAKPTEKHLKKVKRIFRYLQGTINTGLWYTKDSTFELTGFLDADYAGCKDTFKSTSGGAQFLGEKLVSWSSKKQDCTALSTVEAKYVSLSSCYAQVLWMRHS